MRGRTAWTALTAGALALTLALPAAAQDFPDYVVDIGLNGGFAWWSTGLDLDQPGTDDVQLESGWLTGAQIAVWPSSRFGIRGNLAYTERSLKQGSAVLVDDVNQWNLSGDLLYRFSEPDRTAIPYITIGAGVRVTNPAGDAAVGGTGETGAQFRAGNQTLYLLEDSKFEFLAGIGTDLRVADNFSFRLELSDRLSDAPFVTAAEVASGSIDDGIGKVEHQISGQVGAHLLLGLDRPRVVAIEPAPPAPPAPEPEPQPEPRRDVTVCVIDPGQASGIRLVDAVYFPNRRDTVVMRDGMERPIEREAPSMMVASRADWFVRGEPLTLELGPRRTVEFTTWQRGRVIDRQGELAFLGTVRGLPVFAAASDVRDVAMELRDANRMEAADLNALLRESEAVREDVAAVQYLYVPLEPVGCVFQAVQKIEEVRKK